MIIWKINEKCLSLQRQNNSFDYAAECGEQDLIDTTPFESHLRVAFIFQNVFWNFYQESLESNSLLGEKVKNRRKNLEDNEKIAIFAQ